MGSGKIQDGKPESEKNGHSSTETVEIEWNGNDILYKLKTTIEKIKQIIGEGAEITRKEFSEWGKTLKDIVEGETESEAKDNIDNENEEENGSKDE